MQNALAAATRVGRHEAVLEGGFRAVFKEASADEHRSKFRGGHSEVGVSSRIQVKIPELRSKSNRLLFSRDYERRLEYNGWRQIWVSATLVTKKPLRISFAIHQHAEVRIGFLVSRVSFHSLFVSELVINLVQELEHVLRPHNCAQTGTDEWMRFVVRKALLLEVIEVSGPIFVEQNNCRNK